MASEKRRSTRTICLGVAARFAMTSDRCWITATCCCLVVLMQVLTSGQSLNDDRWHTVYIKRRAHLVEVTVDNNSTRNKVEMTGRSRVFSITSMVVGSSITGNGSTFTPTTIRNGGTEQRFGRTKRALRRIPSASRRLHRDVIGDKSVIYGRDFTPSPNNASVVRPFVGKIQQLTVNGRELLELIRTGTARDGDQGGGKTRTTGVSSQRSNDEISATFIGGRFDPPTGSIRPETAVTFRSSDAYTVVRMRIHLKFTIFFKLKTSQRDGLVLYIGGERDFLAVELVDGQVRYLYDVGGGPRMVRVQVQYTISDNRWHDIAVMRNELTKHELRVDEATSTDITRDPSELGPAARYPVGQSAAVFQSTSSAVHFDVGDQLFIGGAPRSVFAGEAAGSRHIRSRVGFQGCLANVDLGGDIRPLVDQGAKPPDEFADQVAQGCEGPVERCTSDACDNAGKCIQEWDSRTCDCDMTSFSGIICDEDGIAYKFGGQQAGLMTVTFPTNERVDSLHDQLAFGFSTVQRDAVFVHVTSGNSNDFISVELVDGNVVAMYNMGVSDHVVRLLAKRFSDGNYHVVRFWRNGANSSLQVDDFPAVNTQPTGRQHTLFNSQAQIFVGGRKDTLGNVLRPFRGTLAGLVFNRQKVFQMAADDDLRVGFDGEVERDTRPLRPDFRKRTTPRQMTAFRQNDVKTTALPSIHDKMQSNSAADGSSPTRTGCQGKQDGGTASGCVRSNFTDALYDDPSNVHASSGLAKDPDRTTRRIADNRDRLPVPLPPSFTSASGAVTSPTAPSAATNRLNSSSGSVNKPLSGAKPAAGAESPSGVESSQRLAKTSPSTAAGTSSKTPTGRSTSPTPKAPTSGRQAAGGAVHGSLAASVALIAGCVAAIVLLLLALAFGVYKYRSRDEGVYRIDDAKNYFAPNGSGSNGVTLTGGAGSNGGGYETCGMNPLTPADDGRSASGSSGSKKASKSRSKKSGKSSGLLQQQQQSSARAKRKENREWYV